MSLHTRDVRFLMVAALVVLSGCSDLVREGRASIQVNINCLTKIV